jgi:glycosyltransferase involved in cell wall biosynthesis
MRRTILHICPPSKGGIGIVIKELLIGLEDRFRFLVAGYVPDYIPERFLCKTPLPFPNSIKSTITFQKKLIKLINDENISTIHVHGFKGALLIGLGNLFTRLPPVIYTVHNSFDIKNIRYVAHVIEEIIVKDFRHITAVSEPLYDDYLRRMNKWTNLDIQLIPNGIDISPYINIPYPERESKVTILNIGRLVRHKGQDILLKAASIIHKEYNIDFELIIAGDGPWKNYLLELTENLGLSRLVSFLGHSNNIPELLAECHIFVLPSRSEGTPLSLLEAMAAGRPVVASNIGGIPYILKGDCGFLVPPEDPRELAKTLCQAMKESVLKGIGEKGRDRVAKHYSLHKILENYGNTYYEIVGD